MPVAAVSREGPRSLHVAARLVSIALVVAALWVAQAVLIPIALAAFVTFLMSPLVTRLDRLGLPRVLAVLVVSGAVTGTLAGVGFLVVGQLGQLAEELPEYRDNIRTKLADLRVLTRGGTIERVQSTIRDISEDVESDVAEEQGRDGGAAPGVQIEEPVRVRIEESRFLGEAEYLTPVASIAATAGLTMLLSIFMLIKREDLRNRLVSLAGHTSLVVTTKAFAEAGQRISRYLLMQFIINATMGLAVGIGLYFIGVPYAALWGLSATVLRYVPYVGPWIAALLPIAVSVITAPGWEQVVIVVALFVVLELLSNNVMEPLLYGQSVGLSAIAVIVSAIFWTWIWGPIGLVLATPMTACIVVLARYIPELAFIDRLLSEGPALKPHLSLYQRLLARDEDEATDIVEAYRETHSLEETCDELLLGALLALKRDLAADRILRDDGDFVASALDELVDELADASADEDAEKRDRDAAPARRPLIVGLPVRDRVDEIALEMLGVLLQKEPCDFEIVAAEALVGEKIAEVEARRPAAACILTLPPGDMTATRHAAKRLRARVPGVAVIVGRLGGGAEAARTRHLMRTAGVREVGFSLAKLAEILGQIARETARRPVEQAHAEEGTPELTASR